MRDDLTKKRWETIVNKLSNQFADGDPLDLDAIIYLIGIQEFGKVHETFKKDDKVNLMHIAICKLLEPFGYYAFDYTDADGWPHYNLTEPLPALKAGEQAILMKNAIIQYFLERDFIE
jgi:hypothetical protein